jgi:hypothetical protein
MLAARARLVGGREFAVDLDWLLYADRHNQPRYRFVPS